MISRGLMMYNVGQLAIHPAQGVAEIVAIEYAVTEEGAGRRSYILVYIECDRCGSRMSGWTKSGQDKGLGTEELEWHYCPLCST